MPLPLTTRSRGWLLAVALPGLVAVALDRWMTYAQRLPWDGFILREAALLLLSGLAVAGLVSSNHQGFTPNWKSPFGRLAIAGLITAWAALLAWESLKTGWLVWALAAPFVLGVLYEAWRLHRTQTMLLSAAVLWCVLFAAQPFLRIIDNPINPIWFTSALSALTEAAFWAAAVVTTVSAGLAEARVEADRQGPVLPQVGLRQRLGDLLTLTRPVVVLLLLVTAYAGMIVGARGWPPLSLAVWTLAAGALSAGGAQAINQYVDRDIDLLMGRTAKRPIPAGRMTPAEGLAWGLGLCAVSVYLVAAFVNPLATGLLLAGILYYVILYTLVLKRTSPQNIVIGGGAGALAPVVGYAAAAGRLDLTALFLFTIVFLWTPPHFWALAIVRLKDYARANVPMLPVVRGEAYTRRQIMVYSLVLGAVTLSPPVLGLAGGIYLATAVLLDLWLLRSAWQLVKQEGNKVAWGLYRTSSMYLAFLFLALVADVVIKTP